MLIPLRCFERKDQYINNKGVYRQTQLYSSLMLLCCMFRPITVAIFRLLREDGFLHSNLQCHSYYTGCPRYKYTKINAYIFVPKRFYF
jgi:hypothetical protein